MKKREGVDAELHYRELYEQTPAMLHSIDAEGRLVGVSEAWLARLGYTRDEVIGHKSVEFLTADSARHAREVVLPHYYATGKCTDVSYTFVAKNGDHVDVLLSATAERDESGKFVRSMAALTDVTERNQLAARLDQAKRMETIGQLAGGVAHDLNNILHIIRAECSLALDGASAQGKRDLEAAMDAVASGERLARQLLTIAGKSNARPEHVDVDRALRAAARHVRPLLPAHVSLEERLVADGATIWIDPGHFEQALLNLLLNARDATTKKGTIVLTSHLQTASPVTSVVRISVTDEGIGMNDEALRRATEPLFTTKPNGTGLGLASTRRIVEGASGTLKLASREGEGTVVEMIYPALRSSAEDDRKGGSEGEKCDSSRVLSHPRALGRYA